MNLVGLNEQRWPEDLLTRSAMALVLLGILRASGYFGIAKTSTSADTYTNNELFIGSLLLRHLQVLLLLFEMNLTNCIRHYKKLSELEFIAHDFFKVIEGLGIF